jgi:UDP-glucose 4-epimerase
LSDHAEIVVTGASGFLGRVLSARLRDRGHSVIAVSRTRFVPPAEVIFRQVAAYSDISLPAGSVLIHLAEPRYINQMETDSERHALDTIRLSEVLLAQHAGRAIYASSVAVYGDISDRRHKPTEAVHPLTSYGRAKLECERRFLAAGGTVARLSNLYGQGMASNNVVSDILAQIPGTRPLTVESADPIRDFLWVEDAADALIQLVERDSKGIFNVATGRSVSVGELAEITLRIAGESGRPMISRERTHPPSQIYLDVSDTTTQIGWTPKTMIEQGVSKLLNVQ